MERTEEIFKAFDRSKRNYGGPFNGRGMGKVISNRRVIISVDEDDRMRNRAERQVEDQQSANYNMEYGRASKPPLRVPKGNSRLQKPKDDIRPTEQTMSENNEKYMVLESGLTLQEWREL